MKIELGLGEESLLRVAPWSKYPTQVDDIGAQGIVGLRSAGVELRVAGKIRRLRLYGDPSNPSVDSLESCVQLCHNPMKKSTNTIKRKIGRPNQIGADKFVGLRLPGSLMNRVGTWAKQSNVVSRSEAIRLLIEKGLEK